MHDHRKDAGLRPLTPLSLIGAAALLTLAACEPPGPETREPPQPPGQEAQPDPQLGAQPGDVDIEARSTEETRAARNRAATEAAGDGDAAGGGNAAGGAAEGSTGSPGAGGASSADSAEGGQQVAVLGSSPVRAHATLEPTEGNEAHGDASFIETEEGLEIIVTMARLTPGQHGIHVHENGDCSGPNAEGAGDHFNPGDSRHGAPTDDPSERHAGDLGNISADSTGDAELTLTMPDLALEGTRGVVGRAIIVHADQDDFTSQPSGESGDPVSCGVIEARGTG